ncbi:hypothetical protein NEHOM01_1124 [Nematocida homosporus]|uniref:uncharacterized protein n=1 Tax=Nematocida homosporus TaxID=1912981 RepID=UPI00221EEE80|nr:uncharacterized protein NEHOM01_1124 [Nematocida homosporus]KAI5185874.1 hypothetical protein NEHOM01_1124 [Nematocida homosporus]
MHAHLERIKHIQQEMHKLQSRSERLKQALKKEIKEFQNQTEVTDKKSKELIKKAKVEIAPSICLKLILGIHELKLPERARHAYKSDYETLKMTSTLFVTVLTAANLVLFRSKLMDTLQILIHMYIYSTLTIREHILINNGSNIKRWWLVHHYICIVISGMMLSCPDGPFKQIRTVILKFLFLLSISQVVQYQYQRRRLYVLRSLEKADPLETTSDVMSASLSANFGVVSLVLVGFQIIQLYVAYYLYTLHCQYQWRHYQPLVGALLIATMAIGNAVTIIYTFYKKLAMRRTA